MLGYVYLAKDEMEEEEGYMVGYMVEMKQGVYSRYKQKEIRVEASARV
jgi:hypothetical protein